MLFSFLLRVAVFVPVAILRPLCTETDPGRTRVSCACNLCVGARWAYLAVIAIVLCPMSSCTVFKSTPAITNLLANVCPSVCQVTPSILA